MIGQRAKGKGLSLAGSMVCASVRRAEVSSLIPNLNSQFLKRGGANLWTTK